VKRNGEGLALKALGGRDYRSTVLGAERVLEHCHHMVRGGSAKQRLYSMAYRNAR
jgi:hypothetical protein